MKARLSLQKETYVVYTIIRSAIAIMLLGFVLGLCSSCVTREPLPSKDDIQLYFDKNINDIACINEFVIHSDYQFIRLDNYDRKLAGEFKVFIDYDYSVVLPDNVKNAVNRLGENGNVAISYSKDAMTVQYEVWYDHHDRGAGFAFVLKENMIPIIPYMFNSEPLYDDGWYYYITDYNATR